MSNSEAARWIVVVSLCLAGKHFLSAEDSDAISSVPGIAVREVQRRQNLVQSAQTLFTAGSRALADKSYGEAMDNFKAAFEAVPPVAAVADQRTVFFKRYQTSALLFANLKIDEARWEEAISVLENVLGTAQRNSVPAALIEPAVRQTLSDLKNRDDLYNMAESPAHQEKVEIVRSKIILAKGYLELGDYDRAERSYHEILSVDPYNSAARRGLENVERHRLDYYDVARDHTRAAKMREVSAGWETPYPLVINDSDIGMLPSESLLSGNVSLERKLDQIVIPTLEFSSATIADVLDLLSGKSQELDVSEPDLARRGVSIVIDAGPESEAIRNRMVTVRLQNIPLRDALKYVTQQAGLNFRVDSVAVVVFPGQSNVEGALMTRTYAVPPGFVNSGGSPTGGGGAVTDPFADSEDDDGVLLSRVTAKDFLAQNGVIFGEGAAARFVPQTSTLVVTNTPQQMLKVDAIVQAARQGGEVLVNVSIKRISIGERALKELGFDWLLGGSNVGSQGVFYGGGTVGNLSNPLQPADFSFSPVGMAPVTAGLRSGNISGTRIDDLLLGASPNGTGRAPGVFSVAGLLTDPQFQMIIRALNQKKGTDVMTSTSVVTKSGQLAVIKQVREFIHPTEYDPPEIPDALGIELDFTTVPPTVIVSDVNDFIATPAQPTAFETRELGSILEVEPTVSGDNYTVNLNVSVDFSDFIGFINYGTPIRNGFQTDAFGNFRTITENQILMPIFEVVRETTNVNVWDGQTIAIGGFHGESANDVEDKVPGAGDLPVVGRAFRSSVSDVNRQALILFLTVNLIDPGGNPINAKPEGPELELSR